jgi:hypothetical protein
MSIILRHRKFPFIMVYSDPKKLWDGVAKSKLLEEIKKDEFDNFVEETTLPMLFQQTFNFMAKAKEEKD